MKRPVVDKNREKDTRKYTKTIIFKKDKAVCIVGSTWLIDLQHAYKPRHKETQNSKRDLTIHTPSL
jgi:hypothetical protein